MKIIITIDSIDYIYLASKLNRSWNLCDNNFFKVSLSVLNFNKINKSLKISSFKLFYSNNI